MPIIEQINFSEWIKYTSVITNIMTSVLPLKREYLRNVASRYRSVILDTMLSQNIKYTGTYEQSVKIVSSGVSDNPEVSLVIDPVGPQSDRIGIYWKVLEFGAGPNENISTNKIVDWAASKFGDPSAGYRIAHNIRTRGINPHPIIQSIFHLIPPEGQPTGLTTRAQQIAEEEAGKFITSLERVFTISSSGVVSSRIPKGQVGGGRFTFK